MSHRLRKPTRWYRATVDQQSRIVVLAEDDVLGNPHAVRKVTVIAPGSQRVYACIDPADADIGINRGPYLWPEAPTNFPLHFHLRPEQTLALVAEVGSAEASIIIEYLDSE